MEAQRHASDAGNGRGGNSVMRDIAIKLLESGDKAEGCIKPTAIRIMGRGSAESGILVDLSQVSQREWNIEGAVHLPQGVGKLDCFLLSEGYEPIGFVPIDDLEQAKGIGKDFSKQIQIFNNQSQFLISWKIISTAFRANVEAIAALVGHSCSSHDRFQTSRAFVDISDAIATLREAAGMISEGMGDLSAKLDEVIATYLGERFETFGDTQDLAQAISARRTVLHLTPVGDAQLPILDNLGRDLIRLVGYERSPENLAEAISIGLQAVQLTPEGDENLPSRLSILGGAFMHRFKRTNDLQDLAESISLHSRAVHLCPEGDPSILANLGNLFQDRFERTAVLQHLVEAISLQSKAIRLTPEGDADLPTMLNDLGESYMRRFEHTGDLQDAEMGISLNSQAVRLIHEGRGVVPHILDDLGSAFSSCSEYAGGLHNISEAMSVESHVAQFTPKGHTDLPSQLNNLGSSYLRRFERTGELQDVSQSVSLHSQAIQLTPEGHPALPYFLMNLGISFEHRFERTGDLQDISKSILLQSRAVHLAPEGDEELPSMLNNLGASFLGRFERTGDLQDVAEAISLHSKAIHLTPAGHSGLPHTLMNLGNALMCRFERTGDLQDIAKAISVQSEAVHLIPDGAADRPSMLSNLGVLLRVNRRFDQTGHLRDVSEAISLQSQGVQLTPKGDAGLPKRLNNLATSFLCRSLSVNDSQEAPNGIPFDPRAVQVIPEGDASQPNILNSLRNVLLCPLKHEGGGKDITEAISAQTQAVRLTPEGHAELPPMLTNLGICWYQLFRLCGLPQHLRNSMSSYRWAATCNFGSPHTRLQAAALWAKQLSDLHRTHTVELVFAWETAVRLLALIAGLEETVQRRHAIIQEFTTIPLRAASAAFLVRRPGKALEWLEQGRCLVWGQQAQLRTPLDKLRAQDAALADRVVGVSRRLENAGSSSRTRTLEINMSEKISLEDEAQNHLRLAREWEDLLKEARSIPGFENFLQPSPVASLLQRLPTSGHVVVINVSDGRCDAIALHAASDGPLHIPLHNFSLEKARAYRNALKIQCAHHNRLARGNDATIDGEVNFGSGRAVKRYRMGGVEGEGQVHMVLRCLWNEVVKPILQDLGLLRPDLSSADPLPRVWWCPTGPLSFLPIHAAGNYRNSEAASAMDHVVSSYTPTVTALTKRVSNNHKIDHTTAGILFTCQPEPPRQPRILGTIKEVNSTHGQAMQHGFRTVKLEGDDVSAADFPVHMEKFSCVHLACHGIQDASEPLKSSFVFHKGRLDLNTIMQCDLKNADLAFLSACQTGTGEDTLSDEAVHLAAGMLAAGYRRVVATMWGIKDNYAPKVADDFYDYLWTHSNEDGAPQFDGSLSAYALHHSIKQLRESLGNADTSLLSWIPYVHFGY